MEYNLDVSFKKNDKYTFAYVLGAIYRQALINIGFSADTHLYELPINGIKEREQDASTSFILEIAKLYEVLPFEEKNIFLIEFLEKGRHYNFWYLHYYGYKKFRHLRKKTYEDISPLIKKKGEKI